MRFFVRLLAVAALSVAFLPGVAFAQTPGSAPIPSGTSASGDVGATSGAPCRTSFDCPAGYTCPTSADLSRPGRRCYRPADGGLCSSDDECANGTHCNSGRCVNAPSTTGTNNTQAIEAVEGHITAPVLAVPIPGLAAFQNPTVQGSDGQQYLDIPFLAQYISAVYTYALGIIVTIATVMVVIGGLKWMLARGDSGKVSDAKETLSRAVIGVLLALGSYAILNLLNPELVNLRALRIQLITHAELEISEVDSDIGAAGPSETGSSSASGGGGGGSTRARTAPQSSATGSSDCTRVAAAIRAGVIDMRQPNDRAAFLNSTSIRRRSCIWCYNGSNERGENGPCFDDPPDGVPVSANACKLLALLADAKERGVISGAIRVNTIVGSHSRCASGRVDTTDGRSRCEACKSSVRGGGTAGQSNHWDGRGIDFGNNSDLQKFVVEEIYQNRLVPIDDVIGKFNLRNDGTTCSGTNRSGSAQGPWLVKDGRPNATWAAVTMCGHFDHIHVGVY